MPEPVKSRTRRRTLRPSGIAPGTLIADPDAEPTQFRAMAFGPEGCEEREIRTLEEIEILRARQPVVWLDVHGLADTVALSRVGQLLGFHPLALEDVLNTNHQPKADEYDDHLFIVLRMVQWSGELDMEQVSLFLAKGVVVTFQERGGDVFDPVRERIRHGRGQIRQQQADYLAYALIDAAVDAVFPVLDAYADQLEEAERDVMRRADMEVVADLQQIRRELRGLRRFMAHQREFLTQLVRDPHELLSEITCTHLGDCQDHAVRIMDLIEGSREWSSDLIDFHLSTLNTRMNEVMRVLTVMASIFIPLTFITGLYGMNFDTRSPFNMPELSTRYGYPAVLLVMAITAFLLVGYFRRRGWVEPRRRKRR